MKSARTASPTRRQAGRTTLIVVASLAALASVSFLFLRADANETEAKTAAPPPAPEVTVATVAPHSFTEEAQLVGRVEAFDTVEIRPRVSGHISAVHFQSGATVKEGDVLFTLDDRYYRAEVDLAAAAVTQARARVKVAEREARRADQLFKDDALSAEERDARVGRFEEASAALVAAEATLARAQLDLDYTKVRSPIAGRISRAFVTAGNLVNGSPGTGTLLTTVVSEGEAYVYADIEESTFLRFSRFARERRLPHDAQGRIPVEMGLADETGYSRKGYIESTDNRLEKGTGSLVVRMVFPNSDGALLPGLFARVRLPVAAPESALLISEHAVGTDQSQKFVYVVDQNNTVSYRPVVLGPVREGQRVVRSGLLPGDRVITSGVQRVRPGMQVTATTAPTPATVATLR